MKLSLAIAALALAMPAMSYAQDSAATPNEKYPNTFSSGSANVSPFHPTIKKI